MPPTTLPSSAFIASNLGMTGQTVARRITVGPRALRYLSAGVRCLAIATLACLTTAPLFRKAGTPPAAHPVSTGGAPVSVTADIARRLTPEIAPPGSMADGTLWAGLQ